MTNDNSNQQDNTKLYLCIDNQNTFKEGSGELPVPDANDDVMQKIAESLQGHMDAGYTPLFTLDGHKGDTVTWAANHKGMIKKRFEQANKLLQRQDGKDVVSVLNEAEQNISNVLNEAEQNFSNEDKTKLKFEALAKAVYENFNPKNSANAGAGATALAKLAQRLKSEYDLKKKRLNVVNEINDVEKEINDFRNQNSDFYNALLSYNNTKNNAELKKIKKNNPELYKRLYEKYKTITDLYKELKNNKKVLDKQLEQNPAFNDALEKATSTLTELVEGEPNEAHFIKLAMAVGGELGFSEYVQAKDKQGNIYTIGAIIGTTFYPVQGVNLSAETKNTTPTYADNLVGEGIEVPGFQAGVTTVEGGALEALKNEFNSVNNEQLGNVKLYKQMAWSPHGHRKSEGFKLAKPIADMVKNTFGNDKDVMELIYKSSIADEKEPLYRQDSKKTGVTIHIDDKGYEYYLSPRGTFKDGAPCEYVMMRGNDKYLPCETDPKITVKAYPNGNLAFKVLKENKKAVFFVKGATNEEEYGVGLTTSANPQEKYTYAHVLQNMVGISQGKPITSLKGVGQAFTHCLGNSVYNTIEIANKIRWLSTDCEIEVDDENSKSIPVPDMEEEMYKRLGDIGCRFTMELSNETSITPTDKEGKQVEPHEETSITPRSSTVSSLVDILKGYSIAHLWKFDKVSFKESLTKHVHELPVSDEQLATYLANLYNEVDSVKGSGFVVRQVLRNAIHRVAKDVLRDGLDDGAKHLNDDNYNVFKDTIKAYRKPDPNDVNGNQSRTVKHQAERAA